MVVQIGQYQPLLVVNQIGEIVKSKHLLLGSSCGSSERTVRKCYQY